MNVNCIIVVKSGNSSLKYIDLNEHLVKEEREYVMLNDCKLNNSCKSGNRSLKFIDLNEHLVKEERVCYVE